MEFVKRVADLFGHNEAGYVAIMLNKDQGLELLKLLHRKDLLEIVRDEDIQFFRFYIDGDFIVDYNWADYKTDHPVPDTMDLDARLVSIESSVVHGHQRITVTYL